jgi:2,3-bisphosphoglycerate-independent phosphoglycerate mutase
MAKRPVMLVIMDGWGIREMETGNAVKLGNTPNYDRWCQTLERAVVDASGEAVGLVEEQMGNSEVGHLNIGAGRVVYQDITRINIAIRENKLAQMTGLQNAFATVKKNNSKLHIMGLVSDGGVHSHINHLFALLDITQDEGINPIVHVITDGRDTPTESGIGFVTSLENYMQEKEHGRIGSLSGRYYAMDRDKRWERTQQAFDAIAFRQSNKQANSASEALRASYAEGVTDEFIVPTVIGDTGAPMKIESGDAVVCFNFRADRMRQIVRVMSTGDVEGYTGNYVDDLTITTFTVYEDDLPVQVLFDKEILSNTLAEVLSKAGRKQYHSAETEKYPHVTFFFNGRAEDPYEGETRQIIPSPKVATYDLQPEMSAYELKDATLKRIQEEDDDFILINFANPDMVGHTGVMEAAIKAVETVDTCTNELVEAVLAKGGVAIVTADHGNCDRMVELATGEAHTYHTTNPVPLFVIGDDYYRLRPRGKLADIAPTILDLLGIEQPDDMTGVSFIEARADKPLTSPQDSA